jgi:hypothetical protein
MPSLAIPSLASFCANGTKSLQRQPKNDDGRRVLFDSLGFIEGFGPNLTG